MNASEVLSAVNAGEDKDWEFKSAKGGMPGSLWETYSAMANTDGGIMVLGVKEDDGDLKVHGLDDPAKPEDSRHSEASSQHNDLSSQRNDPVLGDAGLLALAAMARQKARIAPGKCGRSFAAFAKVDS